MVVPGKFTFTTELAHEDPTSTTDNELVEDVPGMNPLVPISLPLEEEKPFDCVGYDKAYSEGGVGIGAVKPLLDNEGEGCDEEGEMKLLGVLVPPTPAPADGSGTTRPEPDVDSPPSGCIIVGGDRAGVGSSSSGVK